jgi:hypothetical protein
MSPCEYYLTWVFTGRVVSTSPNPQVGGPPFVGCPRLLIQFIHSYPPYRRSFPHPQPEDAPCRGDRDPFTMDSIEVTEQNHEDVCQAEYTDCTSTECWRCQHSQITGSESSIFLIVLYTWLGASERTINSGLNSGCFCEIHASSSHSKLQ